MKTAAVILNYNDAEATIEAVRRIESFTAIDFIVAVDNASTDDSVDRLKEALAECSRAVLLKNSRNGGYGYGNNVGVRYAKESLDAELCVIANPDASFDEALIRDMQKVFAEYEDTGAVGAVMRLDESPASEKTGSSAKAGVMAAFEGAADGGAYPEKADIQAMSYDELKRSGWCERGFLRELAASAPIAKRLFDRLINYPRAYYTEHAPLIPVYAVHGSMLMVSTEAFTACGGYDEDMFLYMEEYVLGARLKRAGFRTYLLSEYYLHEGSHSISGSGSSAVKRQSFRNASERVYFRKHLKTGRIGMLMLYVVQRIVMLETRLFVRG